MSPNITTPSPLGGSIEGSEITDGTVDTEDIADSAITNTKLSNYAVRAFHTYMDAETVTSSGTMSSSYSYHILDGSGATVVLALTDPSTSPTRRIHLFICKDLTNPCSLDPGTDTINGKTTDINFYQTNEVYALWSDGTEWKILWHYPEWIERQPENTTDQDFEELDNYFSNIGDTTATWYDWDLSSIVPVHATAVHIIVWCEHASADKSFNIRKRGHTGTFQSIVITTQTANVPMFNDIIAYCDSSQYIQFMCSGGGNKPSDYTYLKATILGWRI